MQTSYVHDRQTAEELEDKVSVVVVATKRNPDQSRRERYRQTRVTARSSPYCHSPSPQRRVTARISAGALFHVEAEVEIRQNLSLPASARLHALWSHHLL